jgi:hypothetical protein
MFDDLLATTGIDAEVVRELLNAGHVWDAWEKWCETCKDPLDTYNWDSQALDITID